MTLPPDRGDPRYRGGPRPRGQRGFTQMFEDLFSSADVQRRKSNRRLGAIGTGLGVLAFLGGGALAVDFIMTNPPDLTIAQEVFPMLTRSTEFTSSVGLMLGGAGIGFPSATLYLLNRE